MPDVLDALRESGGSTEPDSVFRAELMGRVRAALAAPDVSGQESALVPNSRRSTGHDRRRTSIVLAVAVLVAAAIAGIVWYGARRTGEPATPSVDTSLSDRAFAPLSGEVFAVAQAADGLVLDHRQFAVTENGPRISPPASPPSIVPGPPGGESIVDLWVGISSVYTVSCCDDAGGGTIRRSTGDDWFDGDVVGNGTRFDGHLGASADQVYVDALTGTVTLGQTVIDEPGAVDVTLLSPGWAAALVAGDDPHLVVYYAAAGFTGAPPDERTEWAAPDGACSLVGLDVGVVVFSDHADGDEPCVADHGTALDIGTGGEMAEFDLPEPVRNVDSDHAHLMAATTANGGLWVGTLEPQPAWYRLADGDFLVANVWGPS